MMNKLNIPGSNPYIKISKAPSNNCTNYSDEEFSEKTLPIYRGFLLDGELQMSFYGVLGEDSLYHISTIESIFLHGTNPSSNEEDTKRISANPYIVNAIFSDSLKKYSIELNQVVFHGFSDFVSTDFSFTNEVIKKEVYRFISKEVEKQIFNK